MRRPLVWFPAVCLSVLAVTAAIAQPAGRGGRFSASAGFDVSWPQCSGTAAHHMPSGRPSYVIFGLTYGRGHTANPCLASQLAWARTHGVRTGAYLVASFPSRIQRRLANDGLYGACHGAWRCRLRNDGARQAADAVATMRTRALNSPRIWIDVEFRHTYRWTRHNHANAAVIQGIVRGLKHAHVPMGVYTTSYMWRAIVGRYSLHVPNWLPVGHGGPRKALKMCTTTATGGPTWVVQYTRSLDHDRTCPVLDGVAGRHGRLWRFRKTTQKLFSAGAAVRAIQRHVGGVVTGQFGPATMIAVKSWQQTNGLEQTGEVHPIDWRAMGAYRLHGARDSWLGEIAGKS